MSPTPANLISARPRFAIGGRDQARLGVDLIRLEVHQDENGLATLEAAFDNFDRPEEEAEVGFLYFDGSVLDLGVELVVRAGDVDDEAVIFRGLVTFFEAVFPQQRPPEVRIRAEDHLQLARMGQRSRIFEDASDADVIARVAQDRGWQSRADASGTTRRSLWQIDQSDLALLRERACAADATLALDDRTLSFVPRRGDGGERLQLRLHQELLSFTVAADLAHQRSTLKVHGWSVADKEALHGEAGPSDVAGEADGGVTGPAMLEDLGLSAVEHIHLDAPATASEADAQARAHLRQRARRFVRGHGFTSGSAGLTVGRALDLQGLGPRFSGRYTATAVRHTFDRTQGMRTAFTADRVDLGRPA